MFRDVEIVAFAVVEHKLPTNMTPKNTICLWFNKDAHDAARFYAATFPDSKVTAVHEAAGDYPSGKRGKESSDVEAPEQEAKQREYQPNDKCATHSAAKGQS